MDRKQQLSNVAFGGDWSEAVEPGERTALCLLRLAEAVRNCQEEDPATPDVLEALDWLAARISRGALLRSAFLKAAQHPIPELRQSELWRTLRTIRSLVGEAAGR
ncbi:hypothetical protein SAMN06265173_1077 [Thalassovita litoralis]|jgi:hypothetical protein|uniref:Uncharacterized protein n=1 Tax=Thalassovita litoralis TaxID=1010611 RepID=A0A521CJY9_9RHOB|nr:hypothetical protein SAMN06265173_1077 [Thalassovita litoralis]